jgi:ribosomal protein S18 acetylase RimI-like enzyme
MARVMDPDGIVEVEPRNAVHVRAISRLHGTLLRRSPVPRLGTLFMERFFYSTLIRDGAIRAFLYRVDGAYVGFLSLTERPFTFMRDARRRHFLRLALILCLSVVSKPSRLTLLADVARAGRHRVSTAESLLTGEILSFGVLEPYLARRDIGTHLRISNALFDHALGYFRERGMRQVEWNVDGDNLRAVVFYHSYGATMQKSPLAWPSDYRVRLRLSASEGRFD